MSITPPNIVITGLQCCGYRLRNMGGVAIEEAFISETSSHNPYDPTYQIFVNDENDELYFVKESFNPDVMAEPLKFSEVDTAASVSDMAFFVGFLDNGDGTYTNYNYTLPQLASYFGSLKYTSTVNAASVTAAGIDERPVKAILTDRAAYQVDEDFTQSGNAITWVNNNNFYIGQKMTFIF